MTNTPPKCEASLTIDEFCALERLSRATYFKMQAAGNGPDEIRIPGINRVSISPEAHRRWREKHENSSPDVIKERAKNSERARRAGNAAIASGKHYSQRYKVVKVDPELWSDD